MMAHVLII